MPDISKIKLPGSGGVYNIKDAVARQMISGGVSFSVAWDGTGVPDISAIPEGVVVTYSGVNYTGILSANDESVQPGAFYLIRSTTAAGVRDVFDEYVAIGAAGSRTWEKIGDTQIDFSDMITSVTLNKDTDGVLGEGTNFTASSSAVTFANDGETATVLGANTTFNTSNANVSFSGTTTDRVLGENTTFNTSVTPSLKYLSLTPTTNDFVTDVTPVTGQNLDVVEITTVNGTEPVSYITQTTTNKLDTTTIPDITEITDVNVSIPNVTQQGTISANASTWQFHMGDGTSADNETLVIEGGNGNPYNINNIILGQTPNSVAVSRVTHGPTNKTVATGTVSTTGTGSEVISSIAVTNKNVAKAAANPISVATGSASVNGTGTAIVTGIDVGVKTAALTGVSLVSNNSSTSGSVQVTESITSASTTAVTSGANGDIVEAVTDVGTGTVAGQSVTVGSTDRQTVIKTLGTATAAAQTISVDNNDIVTALTDGTDIRVGRGGQ